ncbi:MAG TPA: UPF0182 family protein [Spirochaetota bacterium]|nr:UPF0182 family protein [Spirochaetota bacterium]HRS76782.1 UPF0182 family protein [Spirochaetota bacterium]HRT74349.1 UPF0182 family protein [Spirochaetota bacterium]
MNKKYIIGITVFVILYAMISFSSGFYADLEWFRMYKGLNIFWVLFFTKFNVHILFGLIFIGIFSFNFLLIRVLGGKGRIFANNILNRLQLPVLGTPKRALFIILAISVVAAGFMMGGAASSFWKEYLMFTNAVPFTGFPKDPIFGQDLGLYVFKLPFLQFLYGWLMSALVITALFSVLFHIVNGGILFKNAKLEFSLFARAHISTLLAMTVFLYGLGYKLDAYELLSSKIGKFYGAGYTAVHANLLAYNAAMVISFIASALFLFNIFKRSFKLPLILLSAIIPVYFILGVVFPGIQQRFIVVPNEFGKEEPYIKHNIQFTRIAYDIEKVRETPFANKQNLTYQDIIRNRNTLENVRLWDWRPLKQTYKQLQELKPYYFFNDVDVDRYIIKDRKSAVNVSARELSIDRLGKNSQTWQNRHLLYTHGYGVVLSRVDKITSEGQPEMLIYDIPPKFAVDIPIERPEIYFGEHNNSYVITNTSMKEFDYPSGDINKFTEYSGTGGIRLDSIFKRLLFAAAFKDINILISGTIGGGSRIHYRRNIMEMAQEFTPFLDFDTDPYLAISDKKLYWIIDAYTTSDQFPYSTPISIGKRKINYIRNSVKIVIDAYNGTMDYYVADENDPIIRVYQNIFPGIFKKMSAMPADLRAHLRYPESYFTIQARTLLRYHMTNPNVFYNNEDAWHIARQVFESKEEPVHSYYLVTRLPDEKRDEFILIIPFTPYKKDNMIAFLTAKCDMPDYGELKLYMLPKDKLSYGPLQVEARINQNPDISKQLALWSQKGSSIIRGNMLAIPIEESILFIEPLYLKAESSEMPELKRVIVAFSDRIVMEKDLPAALERLFSGTTFIDTGLTEGSLETRLRDLAVRAMNHYNQAEASMREGNWSKYGEHINMLKEILERMNSLR